MYMPAILLALSGLQIGFIVFFCVLAIIALTTVALVVRYFNLWLQARLSGVDVAFVQILGMRFRKINAKQIVLSMIRLDKARLDVPCYQLETHYLAGGRLDQVVNAAIAYHRLKDENLFEYWCGVDLAGYDCLDAAHKAAEGKLNLQKLDINKLNEARVQRLYDTSQ